MMEVRIEVYIIVRVVVSHQGKKNPKSPWNVEGGGGGERHF